MNEKSWLRVLKPWSDQSKIQKRPRQDKNPKWVGLSVIGFVLVVAVPVAPAQQPTKIPRIGYLSPPLATGRTHRGIPPRTARVWLR